MSTATLDERQVQEYQSAYRTIDVDRSASPVAIRLRYLELAHTHHPDKWPHGSPEQERAAARMRDINASFQLIRHAPLREYVPPAVQLPDADARAEVRHDRSVSVFTDTIGRFVLGIACGGALAFVLARRGVPGAVIYAWLLPLLLGLAFTSPSTTTQELFRLIWWWA